jgi:hypothetical protein
LWRSYETVKGGWVVKTLSNRKKTRKKENTSQSHPGDSPKQRPSSLWIGQVFSNSAGENGKRGQSKILTKIWKFGGSWGKRKRGQSKILKENGKRGQSKILTKIWKFGGSWGKRKRGQSKILKNP